MADFCNQCAEDMGFPHGDLAGITKPEDQMRHLYAVVLCEGCGPIQVNKDGYCISDCDKHHMVKTDG